MKKNVLPLVIIALVIAVVSTGIFYGLIVSRMDGSARTASTLRYVAVKDLEKGHVVKAEDFRLSAAPDPGSPAPSHPEDLIGRRLTENLGRDVVLTEHVLTPSAQRGLPAGIPDGMRAVTLHISDSSSVVQMLHPGDKVDVQALINRNRNGETDLELRTLLQNATVFNIVPPEPNQNLQGRTVLTVLSSPQDSERLSVADAGARLRVVLRNRGDEKIVPLGSTSVLSLAAPPRPVVTTKFAVAKPVSRPVELDFRLFEVAADQVASFAPGAGNDALSVKVGQNQKAEKSTLLASSRMMADRSGEFIWKAADLSSVKVRVEALDGQTDGDVRLRIQPESSSTDAATQKADSKVQLSGEQSAVVSGFHAGHKGRGGQLVLVITPVRSK
ncbi:Flp pilus assembly protein CpaB [Bryobacter aggregatus]|uniref:Flp pilus assembly protein CpaB n=1 Tax=Bryobacter aggregatus TaxID=360054 RepID=UPI0004E0D3C5|nr:Flp pilus assembly protein CpaB [Bryobacter aggregatus]